VNRLECSWLLASVALKRRISKRALFFNPIPMRNILLASFILLTACMTPRKVENYLDKHQGFAADYAARKFPPKVEYKEGKAVIDSTEYNEFIQAVTESYDLQLQEYQKLLNERDSVQNILIGQAKAQGHDPVIIRVPYASPSDSLRIIRNFLTTTKIPGVKISKTDTITVENTARIVNLNEVIKELDRKIATLEGMLIAAKEAKGEAEHASNKWRLYFFILLAVFIGYIFRKRIFNLLNPIKAFWPF
jgi:hypothetical protein